MGWHIEITTTKPISAQLLEPHLNEMPRALRGFGGINKQDWGWSMSVDVRIEAPRKIILSGSYSCSGKFKDWFAEALINRLKSGGIPIEAITGDVDP